MKNKTFLLLALLAICCQPIWAQSPISNATELAAISMNGNYYLTADITVDQWTALGTFTGTLDGRGFCISMYDITPSADGFGGLFSITNGAFITNLVVCGFLRDNITAAGGIAGKAINTTIRNSETSMTLASDLNTMTLGGIVGIMEGGALENCCSNSTFEGFRAGGLAGTVSATATIRNSFCNSVFIIHYENEMQTGGLAFENHGTIENCYITLIDGGWYLPSIGQLNLLFGFKGMMIRKGVSWPDAQVVSSTLPQGGYVCNIDKDFKILGSRFEVFNNAAGGLVRFVHDVYGSGYNVGDFVNIGGAKSVVFYINEDGMGGLAFPFYYSSIKKALTQLSNEATHDFFYNDSDIDRLNRDYAESHDGHVVTGETVATIPERYHHNNGKFFSYTLRDNDISSNSVMTTMKAASENYLTTPSIKQFAYTNTGLIRHCYYYSNTELYELTASGSYSRCERYGGETGPCNYGGYGPRLYENDNIGPIALADTLNGWVAQQNNDNYAPWTIPGTTRLNHNFPVHKFHFNNGTDIVNTVVLTYGVNHMDLLRYSCMNSLPDNYITKKNVLAYYAHRDDVNTHNVMPAWPCPLYITEEATLKGSYYLNANVAVTFDNSDASGFAGGAYDWHMFSTSLTYAPVGINYKNYTNGGPHGNPSQVVFNVAAGYFPTDTPYSAWDFYCYDETNYGWINFKRKTGDHYNPYSGVAINYSNETDLIPGKGYLWAIDKKTCLQAFGEVTNGNVNISLNKQGTTAPGYNLVGNPYQAYLDFDVFSNDNASVLAQQAYTLLDADHHGYIHYCTGASDNPAYAPRYLHPHQGFFVEAAQHNARLTFKPDHAVTTPSSSFRDEAPHYPLVNLIATDEEGRSDHATVELNRPDDGGMLKMDGLTNCNGELSVSHNAQEYSIAFLNEIPDNIPVHFSANRNGRFTLSWSVVNTTLNYLHLVDHMTGAEVDCLNQHEYAFDATTNDYPSRFALRLHPSGVDEIGDETGDAFTTVQVIDALGRIVAVHHNKVSTEGLAPGVYMLRLINNNNVKTKKIVVR